MKPADGEQMGNPVFPIQFQEIFPEPAPVPEQHRRQKGGIFRVAAPVKKGYTVIPGPVQELTDRGASPVCDPDAGDVHPPSKAPFL